MAMMNRTLPMAVVIVLSLAAAAAAQSGLPAGAVEFPPVRSSSDQQAMRIAQTGNAAALGAFAAQWVRAEPRAANAWFYDGLAAELNGTKAWAIDDYRHALTLEPGQGASTFGLGRALFSLNKDLEAIEPLRQATIAYPRNSRIWADYGLVLGSANRIQDAAAALQRSVTLDPGNAYHAGELADAYAAIRQYARAIPLYAQASRKTPWDDANVTWLGNLGQAYDLSGNYAQSIQVLQATLRYTPNDADVWEGLWDAYLHIGDLTHAAQAKATVARLTAPPPRPPDDPATRFSRISASIARQQHENYLHSTGQLNLNEHLP
jgi:tetratricopeptide (TPR) repeat protein